MIVYGTISKNPQSDIYILLHIVVSKIRPNLFGGLEPTISLGDHMINYEQCEMELYVLEDEIFTHNLW